MDRFKFRISDLMKSKTEQLISGACSDWTAYQRLIAEIAILRELLEMISDLERSDDDEDDK